MQQVSPLSIQFTSSIEKRAKNSLLDEDVLGTLGAQLPWTPAKSTRRLKPPNPQEIHTKSFLLQDRLLQPPKRSLSPESDTIQFLILPPTQQQHNLHYYFFDSKLGLKSILVSDDAPLHTMVPKGVKRLPLKRRQRHHNHSEKVSLAVDLSTIQVTPRHNGIVMEPGKIKKAPPRTPSETRPRVQEVSPLQEKVRKMILSKQKEITHTQTKKVYPLTKEEVLSQRIKLAEEKSIRTSRLRMLRQVESSIRRFNDGEGDVNRGYIKSRMPSTSNQPLVNVLVKSNRGSSHSLRVNSTKKLLISNRHFFNSCDTNRYPAKELVLPDRNAFFNGVNRYIRERKTTDTMRLVRKINTQYKVDNKQQQQSQIQAIPT